MNAFLVVVVLGLTLCYINAKESPPKVQVYSRNPGEFNKPNNIICHTTDFHPPDITIELLKNGMVMKDAKQSDLAFEQGWHFHLTKVAPFTPKEGDEYSCRVTHMGNSKTYTWVPDM